MNPIDPLTQRGFDHAMRGYPYLFGILGDDLTEEQRIKYAVGYVHARPTGRAAMWHRMPHNQEPAQRDARKAASVASLFGVLSKLFV